MFIEHINMTVRDLDRSIDFYSRLFGFHVRWRGETSNGRPAAHIGNERAYLALFEAAGNEAFSPDYETAGPNHFGFVVEDLEGTRKRLEALGARAHHEADYNPGKRLYFFDPDGIEVELVEYAAGAEPWAGQPLEHTT